MKRFMKHFFTVLIVIISLFLIVNCGGETVSETQDNKEDVNQSSKETKNDNVANNNSENNNSNVTETNEETETTSNSEGNTEGEQEKNTEEAKEGTETNDDNATASATAKVEDTESLVTEEEKKASTINVKRLTPESIVKVKIPKEDVIVKINQIENKDYPIIKLFVSVTDRDGNPLELENPNLFVIEENGEKLLRSNIKSILQQKQSKDLNLIPLSAVLAIDKSGSMALNADETAMLPEEEQPLYFAKNAAIEFLDKIQSYDNVEFIAFDHNINNLGTNFEALEKISAMEASGHTALYGALYSSVKSLEEKEGIKAVILLTDGKNDVARVSEDNKLSHVEIDRGLELAEKLSIPVFTIGLGKGVDKKVLQKIATETHATFFSTGDKEEITKLYDKIRNIINNQYVISYNTKFLTEETEVNVDLYGPNDTRNYQNPEELVEKEKEFKDKIDTLDSKIEEYDKKYEEVQEKEKELNKKEDRLNKKEEDLNVREENLDTKEKKLEETRVELEKKKEELEKKDDELEKLEKELDMLDSQLDDKDQKLAGLQSELAKRENTLNDKRANLEEREKELNETQANLEKLKKSLDMREKQLNTLNKELNDREDNLEELSNNLNQKEQELNELEQELLDKAKELSEKEQELKELQSELDSLEETLEEERQRLQIIKQQLIAMLTELGEDVEGVNP